MGREGRAEDAPLLRLDSGVGCREGKDEREGRYGREKTGIAGDGGEERGG
jgi:hypothetical protein